MYNLLNTEDCLEILKLYEYVYAHPPTLMVITLAYF
jgi:hypothetical protein